MGTSKPVQLTAEQQQAVDSIDQSIALLASAGSGKTAVLVERYLKCLQLGHSPFEILTVTFTVDAATQLRRRLSRALDRAEFSPTQREKWKHGVETSPFIGTLHSFCYRVVEQWGTSLKLPKVNEILTVFQFSEVFEDFYQSWVDRLSEDDFSRWLSHFSAREIREFLMSGYPKRRRLALAVTELDPQDEDTALARWIADNAAPFWNELESFFQNKGIYGFDDLEYWTAEIFEQVPAALAYYHERLKYFFVDEFQDTSPEQWRIVQRLAAKHPDHLFVVGDPKQSIYRFRNADYRVFYDACRKIVDRGGQELRLSMNFRSNPKLLESINALSAPLFLQSEIAYEPMLPGLKTAEEGSSQVRYVRFPGERGETVANERALCLNEVKALLASGIRPGQIAILFRVSERITDYFDALLNEGIPVVAKTSQAIFQNYETLDLSNYLMAVANPSDDFALAAFLRSRFLGWSIDRLQRAIERPGKSLLEKLREEKELDWYFALVESGETLVEPVLYTLFEKTHFIPESRAICLEWLTPLTQEPLTLWEAIKKVESWKRDGIKSSLRQGDDDRNSVQLMTVHGAKGLEFDHVFLVDNLRQQPRSYPVFLTEDRKIGLRVREKGEAKELLDYSLLLQKSQSDDLAESMRILYVALTRAKEQLHIFLPENESLIPKSSWGELLTVS